MKRVWAIARLTLAEGIRMRIVLVFLIVLAFLVVYMSFALRGDETLTGRLQNFLAYSLGALSLLLSLATVFFSCATLTTELRECSLHLVVTKPVTRFQILLGKWLGVNLLNVGIVLLCGAAIYGFAVLIRSLPAEFERDRAQVRDIVWTARVGARPVEPEREIAEAAREHVAQRIAAGEIEAREEKPAIVARINELKNQWLSIGNGDDRVYRFEGLTPPESDDTVIQIRYRIRALPLPADLLAPVAWTFLDPESGVPLGTKITEERSGDRHQFLFRGTAAIKNGVALLQVTNPYDPRGGSTLYFEGDDSLEILYRVSSFEANFVRALGLVLLQLTLLSAIGLFFSVFVSFPVACLCTCSFFLLSLAMPFVLESIGANQEFLSAEHDPYGRFGPAVRTLLVPLLKYVFPNLSEYSSTRHLVDSAYITLDMLGRYTLRTLVAGGLLLLVPGWWIFHHREVAEVTV